MKVSVEQIRRNRQIVLAVGGHDEFTLSARFDATYLHEPPNPFLPNSYATSPKFSPDPRLAIFAFAGLNQQSSIAEALAGNRRIIRNSSSLMSKITAGTDIACFALSNNRPATFVPFNPSVLHTDFRAKYAVAFFRMLRSSFTLASSALSRVNSICSALIDLAPAPAN